MSVLGPDGRYTYVYMCASGDTCMCMRVCMRICICMRVCMRMCMCIHVCMRMAKAAVSFFLSLSFSLSLSRTLALSFSLTLSHTLSPARTLSPSLYEWAVGDVKTLFSLSLSHSLSPSHSLLSLPLSFSLIRRFGEVGGWGRVTFSKKLMSPTPRRKWYLTTGRRAH